MPRDTDRVVTPSLGQAPELWQDYGDREEEQNVLVGQSTPPARAGDGRRESRVSAKFN